MKKFIFLLLPFYLKAQEPPKGSNAIIAKGVSFKQIKDSLLDQGFFIDQQNEEDGTIITKPKGVCECKNVDYNQLIISIRVKDSVAKFSGTWNLNFNYHSTGGSLFSNDRTEFHRLEYAKSSLNVQHKIFLRMDAFVRKLTADVSYATL
jgi:hypothetical protein